MIDEKGRLFGKINIVDLIVILVIVIAAVILVSVVYALRRSRSASVVESLRDDAI